MLLKEQFSGGSELDSDNNESDESSEQKQQSSNAQQKCCTNCFTNCRLFNSLMNEK